MPRIFGRLKQFNMRDWHLPSLAREEEEKKSVPLRSVARCQNKISFTVAHSSVGSGITALPCFAELLSLI